MNEIYSVPEIFNDEDGRNWRIVSDKKGSGVDFENRIIATSLGTTSVDHNIRLQQTARIKWNDPKIPSDNSLLFRAVDDNRLTYLLQQSGIEVSSGFIKQEQLTELAGLMSETGLLAKLLMTDYTDGGLPEAVYHQNIDHPIIKLYGEVRRRIQENPTKANVAEIVVWLRKIIKDQPQPEFMKMQGKPSAGGKASNGLCISDLEGDFDDFFDMAWNDLSEDKCLQEIPSSVRQQLPKDVSAIVQQRMEQAMNQNKLHLVPWGKMKIEEPPRTHSIFGKQHKKWKSTEEGVFPRYPHRYFTDGRIFARRHKIPGGTVVIDASGSMNLSSEQINSMVETAPGCVVACYSGDSGGGILRILAKNGKRVEAGYCMPPCGAGNVIDYPALKWAYQLNHPRVWVSDTVVTGVNDQLGTANIVMCAAVVKRGRFYQANNTEAAIQILRNLGRYYRKSL